MTELLRDSVEALKSIRSELNGIVDDSVITRLDGIILELEILQAEDARQYDAVRVLNLLGCAMELVPSIGKLVEYLIELGK
jgi:hypothetical protein